MDAGSSVISNSEDVEYGVRNDRLCSSRVYHHFLSESHRQAMCFTSGKIADVVFFHEENAL